jgi:hypothetical protein
MKKGRILVFLVIFLIVLVFLAINFFENKRDLRVSISGFAVQQSGTVNVTVGDLTAVDFIVSTINWGSGHVDSGEIAVLNTSGSGSIGGGTDWDLVSQGFVIQNVGNTNASIWLKSGKNADDFIGGTAPAYEYAILNRNASACDFPSGFTEGTFYEVNPSGNGTLICDKFQPTLEIEINLKLTIPEDSNKGSLSDSFSYTVEEYSGA